MTVKILQFPVGPLEMNATLVMDIESKETIFFDNLYCAPILIVNLELSIYSIL